MAKQNKAYKFRLYPTEEQALLIRKTFGCVRFVYNKMLAERKETYETFKNDKEALKKMKHPTPAQYKKAFTWDIKKINSPVLIVQGKNDNTVNWHPVQTFYKKLKQENTNTTLKLIPGGDHALDNKQQQLSQIINSWFQSASIALFVSTVAPYNPDTFPILSPYPLYSGTRFIWSDDTFCNKDSPNRTSPTL